MAMAELQSSNPPPMPVQTPDENSTAKWKWLCQFWQNKDLYIDLHSHTYTLQEVYYMYGQHKGQGLRPMIDWKGAEPNVIVYIAVSQGWTDQHGVTTNTVEIKHIMAE